MHPGQKSRLLIERSSRKSIRFRSSSVQTYANTQLSDGTASVLSRPVNRWVVDPRDLNVCVLNLSEWSTSVGEYHPLVLRARLPAMSAVMLENTNPSDESFHNTIIIIVGSLASVFSTDASLPYSVLQQGNGYGIYLKGLREWHLNNTPGGNRTVSLLWHYRQSETMDDARVLKRDPEAMSMNYTYRTALITCQKRAFQVPRNSPARRTPLNCRIRTAKLLQARTM
ncbi:hypothetical protein CLF_102058 [Clonorchis sinensis]|uniref:Uncharacterized protein n=1 Tax=Clonorchis sinensis TaxID=79923 RepID=G7Y770_CLOSI|nr:hypothetical protein CLF_102058 [Clonorchis sinensis]